MCRAEGGVAGGGPLSAGSEDPYLIVGPLISGRGQECRLAEIGPPGEVDHLLGGQLVGVVHDSHGVSEHQLVGEDIDLCEPVHDESLPAWDTCWHAEDLARGTRPSADEVGRNRGWSTHSGHRLRRSWERSAPDTERPDRGTLH